MTTPELRAAAERLRAFIGRKVHSYDGNQYHADLLAVRDAYLAEHHADDDGETEACLCSRCGASIVKRAGKDVTIHSGSDQVPPSVKGEPHG